MAYTMSGISYFKTKNVFCLKILEVYGNDFNQILRNVG